ncbi:MAG: hypothetical protein H7235_07000 [Bdellovibrionaceae bacterium]|nr:hypothetical protein [Pseudobdellovibrionaceae bacterium]
MVIKRPGSLCIEKIMGGFITVGLIVFTLDAISLFIYFDSTQSTRNLQALLIGTLLLLSIVPLVIAFSIKKVAIFSDTVMTIKYKGMPFKTTVMLTDLKGFRIQDFERSFKGRQAATYDIEYIDKKGLSKKLFTFNSIIAVAEALNDINRFLEISSETKKI